MPTSTTAFVQRQNYPHVLSGLAHLDNNAETTLPIPCGGRSVVRLGFPTGTDGTTATFLVQPYPPADPAAPTLDPPFRSLVDRTGAAISITVTDDSLVEIPQLSGCFAFQVVMGTAQSPAADIEVQCVGASPTPFEEADGGVVPGDFAAPALTLGTTNTAGVSGKVLATDSTILTFDATVPVTQTDPSTAAAGSATVAARRDHTHGIATPATPTTQVSGDAATSGAGTGFATDTHKHGFPTIPAPLSIDKYLMPKTAELPGSTCGTATFTANTAYLIPLQNVPATMAMVNVISRVATQSGNWDLGIYSTTDCATFTRVGSLGSTGMPAGATRVATALSVSLAAGTSYFIAVAFDNAVASLACFSQFFVLPVLAVVAYSKASSFPLPTSLTSVTAIPASASSNVPLLFAQVTNGMAI